MVGRVVEHLKNLERQAISAATEAELAEFVRSETLPRLREELAVAEEDLKFGKIQQWLAPLIEEIGAAAPSAPSSAAPKALPSAIVLAKKDPVVDVIGKLTLPPSVPPRNTLYLDRDPKTTFASHTDIGAQLVTTFQPALRQTFAAAISNGRVTAGNQMHVYALRVKAAPFGQAAPKKILALEQGTGRIITVGEWPIVESATIQHEKADVLFLDASYDKIQPDSWVVVEMSAVPQFGADIVRVEPAQRPYLVTKAVAVQADIARAEYGISGKTTRLDLEEDWLKITPPAPPGGGIGIVGTAPDAQPPAPAAINVEAAAPSDQPIYDRDFQTIRNTTVYAQTEELPLAEAPIEDEICHAAGNWLELDGLYSDLKSGRWLIVAGERSDIRVPDPEDNSKLVAIRGVNASELVMLAAVIQDVATETGQPVSQLDDSDDDSEDGSDEQALPNEKLHTFIKLAKNLEYCYRRDAVTIYGNVVKATHGETRKEVLGSGDGSQALQSFALRQPPLTFVAAPNPSGVDSTLKVYVNEVRWQEVDSLAGLAPTDRKFITRTDDAGKTSVTFGNGQRGARLPSGRENVRAEYRNGIGKGGNVRAGQLSLLMTRPLGVKDVVNPLRASGGADKESRDQARKNVPLAVMALDRLVSVPDYADFTRTFAGIGKAAATRLPVGQREIVHVTIAGADDIPIDVSSDLYRNLVLALRQNGDPYQPFQVELRELLLLVVSANVSIVPEYVWDNVATQIRTRMLDRFGFERRDLGQDVVLSDVISTIQAVPGVAYVDIDLLAAIPEKKADGGTRRLLTPEEITESINKLLTERADEQGQPDAQKVHPVSRITVGLAGIEDDTLRPAQLAILSPTVPDTLIVNRI
ncbi:MAG: putative baseplate assembly protein [Roseiflexaceae bacterium]